MILKKHAYDYALRRQEMAKRAFAQPESAESAIEQASEEVKVEAYLHHFHEKPAPSPENLPLKAETKISVRNLNFFYGSQQVLFENTLDIANRKITAFIGPSGCGKSTHLRTYNRIFERYQGQQASGEIMFDGLDVLSPSTNMLELRRRIGMIFRQPTTFPLSVYDNVAYGLKLHYRIPKMELDHRIETALKRVHLLDDLQGEIRHAALSLSTEQQQRLCLARTIALEPEVLLLDEPSVAIAPVATRRFEELIASLKDDFTIVLVTRNMQQAARISDFSAFFSKGYIVEFGRTKQIFTNPVKKQTENYITGRFE